MAIKSADPLAGNIINGTIVKVVFSSPTWAVIVIDAGVGEYVTATGSITSPVVGTSIRLTGEWVNDPKYGRQFKIATAEADIASTRWGVIAYLSSQFIKGVGVKKANKIYDKFGKDTIRIIETDYKRLTEVSGITERIAQGIHDYHEVNHVYMQLMNVLKPDITDNQIAAIYSTYGSNSMNVLKQDPYILIRDISGVGFTRADKIAQAYGIPLNSPKRATAAVVHCLRQASEQGHCYIYIDNLEEMVRELLGKENANMDTVAASIVSLVKSGSIVVDDDDAIYLQSMYKAETKVAEHVQRLLADTPTPVIESWEVEKAINNVEHDVGYELEDLQKQCVKLVSQNGLSIITGGPGTGKTTIIKTLLEMWGVRHYPDEVALAAPTGKAARRIEEVTGRKAQTIHKLLAYTFDKETGRMFFTHNEKNPMPEKLIIVDEASMLDIGMAYALISAVPKDGRLVLVGDIDQLPPIGAGNFFRDLVQLPKIPTVKLEFSHRQQGYIALNANRINHGLGPHAYMTDCTFTFKSIPDKTKLADASIEEYVRLVKKYGVRDVCYLSPMRTRSSTASDEINKRIQEILNPSNGSPEISTKFKVFRLNDRVMQVSNDWARNVANGDMGFITDIDHNTLTVLFDNGEQVEYSAALALSQLVLGYAMTVHKSQGSEYKAAVVVHNNEHYIMLQRNLLYTAVTRAKEYVCLMGDARAFASAAGRVKAVERNTKLKNRI